MAFDVHEVNVSLGDPAADNKQLFAIRAPENAKGGGITIIDAWAVDSAATSSTVSWTAALHKYSAADAGGTPAVNGTIAAAIGGTSDHWAANIPKQFTISSTYQFVDAGEWVVIDYQEENAGNPTNAKVVIQYVMGK